MALRQRRLEGAARGPERDAAHLRPGERGEALAEAESLDLADARCGDELAAHLAARKARFLEHDHVPAGARKAKRARCARRPAADHQRVAAHAQKRWLNGHAAFSWRIHPPGCGQRADTSLPANPARTLASASCRVTSLQPSAQSIRLPASAKPERRGSQATKSRALRAIAASSRARRSL